MSDIVGMYVYEPWRLVGKYRKNPSIGKRVSIVRKHFMPSPNAEIEYEMFGELKKRKPTKTKTQTLLWLYQDEVGFLLTDDEDFYVAFHTQPSSRQLAEHVVDWLETRGMEADIQDFTIVEDVELLNRRLVV